MFGGEVGSLTIPGSFSVSFSVAEFFTELHVASEHGKSTESPFTDVTVEPPKASRAPAHMPRAHRSSKVRVRNWGMLEKCVQG